MGPTLSSFLYRPTLHYRKVHFITKYSCAYYIYNYTFRTFVALMGVVLCIYREGLCLADFLHRPIISFTTEAVVWVTPCDQWLFVDPQRDPRGPQRDPAGGSWPAVPTDGPLGSQSLLTRWNYQLLGKSWEDPTQSQPNVTITVQHVSWIL